MMWCYIARVVDKNLVHSVVTLVMFTVMIWCYVARDVDKVVVRT